VASLLPVYVLATPSEDNLKTTLCMYFKKLLQFLYIKKRRRGGVEVGGKKEEERFDLKISKLKTLWKQRHLHLGCP